MVGGKRWRWLWSIRKNALNLFFLFGSLGFSFSSISSLFLYYWARFLVYPILTFFSPPSFCPFLAWRLGCWLIGSYCTTGYTGATSLLCSALFCSVLFCSAILYSAVLQRLFANKGLLTFCTKRRRKVAQKIHFLCSCSCSCSCSLFLRSRVPPSMLEKADIWVAVRG
jgi:hypothetical protein